MKNDFKDIKGLFLVDNKEATVEAIKKIKELIMTVDLAGCKKIK